LRLAKQSRQAGGAAPRHKPENAWVSSGLFEFSAAYDSGGMRSTWPG